jgi:hypothetical protein
MRGDPKGTDFDVLAAGGRFRSVTGFVDPAPGLTRQG